MKYQFVVIDKAVSKAQLVSVYIFSSSYGHCAIAESQLGIMAIVFASSAKKAFSEIQILWPTARKITKPSNNITAVKNVIHGVGQQESSIPLVVSGTDLQRVVWNKLLEIPIGETWSYGQLAKKVQRPKAHRAVASAVGKNLHAVIIPCHRVIRSDGSIGKYRWGSEIKKQLLLTEAQ